MKSLLCKSKLYTSLLLAASFGFISILTACANTTQNTDETNYHFLRHAEFNKKNKDKPLSDKGKKRAQALVQHFQDTKVSHVYTTHTDRTYDTVAPLAENRGLSVVQVPKQGTIKGGKTVTNRSKGKIAIKPMIKALKKIEKGSSVVISANSGNIFAIMAGLGVPVVGSEACTTQPENCLPCKNKKCFPKKEYNNIWSVTLGANEKVTLNRSRYGN
jgi:hypothetical protein